MKKVRAKFDCIKKTENRVGFEIELHAVADAGGENEKYFKYTPYGELKMGTINKAAADLFTPGKEYYIDFTEVAKE